MPFPDEKCHFRLKNVISGQKAHYPGENSHFRSENVISGWKMLFPDEKCHFRTKKFHIQAKIAIWRSENVISGRKMPFPVEKCHFRSENVISGRKMSFPVGKCHFLSENVISCRKMSFPVGKCHFLFLLVQLRRSYLKKTTLYIKTSHFDFQNTLSMSFEQAKNTFLAAQGAYDKGDLSTCGQALAEFKIQLIQCSSFLPNSQPSMKEHVLTRDGLELGVLYSIAVSDIQQFEIYMTQLKPYYQDFKNSQIPESKFTDQMLGLYHFFSKKSD